MFITEFEIDGRNVRFINASRNTRYGFAHDSELFIDGCMYPIEKQTRTYLNRTWEMYSHQTTMAACVNSVMFGIEHQIENRIKEKHNWKIINAKRMPQFNAEKADALNNDNAYAFYRKIRDHLMTHNCA